jgi:hypothetical protein
MSTAASPPAEPWVSIEPRFNHTTAIDPEVEWALGAGRGSYFAPGRQQRWIPVAIELQGISIKEFAAGTEFLDDGPSRTMWQASLRISPLCLRAESSGGDTVFCAAMVTGGFFEFLRRNERLGKIVLNVALGLPLGTESLGPSLTTNSGHSQP